MVEELDLFRSWTPEMVDAVKHQGRGSSASESMRKYWASLTDKEKMVRLGNTINSESANRRKQEVWDERTPEEKVKRLKRTIHSEEARKLASVSISSQIRSLSSEEKEARLRNSFHSEEAIRRAANSRGAYWSSLSSKEKEEILEGRFHSEEARKKAVATLSTGALRSQIREGVRKYWASLSGEEMEEIGRRNSKSQRKYWGSLTREEVMERVGKSFLSDEAVAKRMKASHVRPTLPESIIDGYLQENFQGEWGYNGDYSLGITIGGKIPDFVDMNGKKEVIEVLGGIGYWHGLKDGEEKIAHYAKYGFRCIIVWEWDCWVPGELDRIFKTIERPRGLIKELTS